MTTRRKPGLAELLEPCRPVPPDRPNILKALLAVQSALGHVLRSLGFYPTIRISGFNRLGGTSFESVWANPAWPITAGVSFARSKITCAFLSETTSLKSDLPWNRCPAQGTALCRRL
jgi:hypothetical protein